MKVRIREAGRVRVVDLDGHLTIGKGDLALREAVQGLIKEGHSQVLVNMKGVERIDSAGIGELVACRKRVLDHDGAIHLMLPNSKVQDILMRVRLELLFTIFDDELKAVGSF
jgi:anti-anti-sigma factor